MSDYERALTAEQERNELRTENRLLKAELVTIRGTDRALRALYVFAAQHAKDCTDDSFEALQDAVAQATASFRGLPVGENP